MGKQGSASGANVASKVVIALIVIALLGVGGFTAKRYYDNRYSGSSYYTQVPVGENVEITDLLDAKGNPVDSGYSYSLVGYDDRGQEQLLEFDVRTDNADLLYQPGTYLKVEASPTLVLSEEPIDESEIPAAALERIQGN